MLLRFRRELWRVWFECRRWRRMLSRFRRFVRQVFDRLVEWRRVSLALARRRARRVEPLKPLAERRRLRLHRARVRLHLAESGRGRGFGRGLVGFGRGRGLLGRWPLQKMQRLLTWSALRRSHKRMPARPLLHEQPLTLPLPFLCKRHAAPLF